MNLADNLRKIRKDNNLSQEQLAEKLGVSRQSVSKWESNQAYPEMDKVIQICKMFNLNIDELLNKDISEVKEEKEVKNNISKYIDDFLSFITKSVDMFTSLKFKDKIKCLFELFFIALILLFIFLILRGVCVFVVSNIFGALPHNIYQIIYNILYGLYALGASILSIIILTHIFKVRYLDYYDMAESKDKEESCNDNKASLEHDEKIVIRDPKHSNYGFVTGLFKFIVILFKIFLIFISFGLIYSLVCFAVLLVLSFLIIKTGLFFIGIFIGLLSAITLNILILYVIIKFIFNKKINIAKSFIVFVISLICVGIGIGLSFIGIKNFDVVDNEEFIETTESISMSDNLMYDNYLDVEYIEKDQDNIEVVCMHSKNDECSIDVNYDKINIHVYNINNFMKIIRNNIDEFNKGKIVDYSNNKIIIYASKENIDKLKANKEKYDKEFNQYQNKVHDLEREIHDLNDELNKCLYE